MLSFRAYFFLSIIFLIMTIFNSITVHEQFYLIIMHLTTSKINKLILINFFCSFLFGFLKILLSFIFGEIRESEKLVP